ncbi:MAG: hypothetical protein AAGD96_26325 [Chloroflexota bacterium]
MLIMTLGSILIGIALLLIVGLFVARPFLLPMPAPKTISKRDQLEAEKEALLAKIRALDFDAETDKQADEEWQGEREFLMQKATEVLRQLEEVGDTDEAIEAAIAKILAEVKT